LKQFILPELPYALDGLAPVLSEETLSYHYGKHHAAYINNLNGLIAGTDFENMPIEDIVARADAGPLFNNSAQAYNHTFYWYGMAPAKGGDNTPTDQVNEALKEAFGDFESFKTQFSDIAAKHFGSGWAWLVHNPRDKKLQIIKTANAETPLTQGLDPLIACDVWEHAYYIDYRNKRPDYVSVFIEKMINWDFAEMHLNRARQ